MTLKSLTSVGTSVWYDNLSRDVLNSGELKSIIDSGVLGLTSNPTIFKKAIADSTDYDSDIKDLGKNITDAEKLTFELMLEDVGRAADLLRPIYDKTGGQDGLASIELSPFLANDTSNSIAQGRNIWKTLNRPNIMIKVPATDAGLPVVTALISEGINVNVTLIFSKTVYERVIDAYLKGIEKNPNPSGVRSVASFFVSRVDSIVSKEKEAAEFDGKIGIDNSKVAYQSYLRFFNSSRFRSIKGANPQRPLWASTGTKDPKYDPLLYVKALAGPNCVNTVPPQTLGAIQTTDFSYTNQLTENVADSENRLLELSRRGIPFESLLFQLQVEGVKSFADSFSELLAAVKTKREALCG